MVEPASFGRQTLHPPRVPWSVLASGAYEVGRALRLYHNYRGLYSQSIVAAMFVPYEIVDISPPWSTKVLSVEMQAGQRCCKSYACTSYSPVSFDCQEGYLHVFPQWVLSSRTTRLPKKLSPAACVSSLRYLLFVFSCCLGEVQHFVWPFRGRGERRTIAANIARR